MAASSSARITIVDGFEVVVATGTLRNEHAGAISFPHRWTDEGVSVEADFTGAHLLHLSAAGCVLNDVHREAERLGLMITGVRVCCTGGFDTTSWASTGIAYSVEIDGPLSEQDRVALLTTVDEVAEIPKAIRAGAEVRRREVNGDS